MEKRLLCLSGRPMNLERRRFQTSEVANLARLSLVAF